MNDQNENQGVEQRPEGQKKSSRRKMFYLVLVIILAVMLGIFLGNMISDYLKKKQMQDYYENLAEKQTQQESQTQLPETQVTETQATEEKDILTQLGITIPEKHIDWESLYQENEDIYAWIYIPGTNIDYPVVQHPTDNEYYVNHNLDGTEGLPATIMTQNYNTKTFLDANTLVYGHNMKNGTMFRNLHEFEDKEFFKENLYVYIYLPETVYVYEIFAEYTWGNELITVSYDFSTEEGISAYLDKIMTYMKKDGQYREGISLSAKNHLLTMSTCTSPSNDDYRYLVQGVLINDPTLTDDEILRTLRSIQ